MFTYLMYYTDVYFVILATNLRLYVSAPKMFFANFCMQCFFLVFRGFFGKEKRAGNLNVDLLDVSAR